MKVNYLVDLLRFEFPRDQFALFGSAPLVVRGIKDENKDLDLIVTQDLWDDIVKVYNPPTQLALSGNLALELTPNIEIFKTWPPFDQTDFLIKNADFFDGVRYVKMEYVLVWKSSLGREKDIEDIKRIKALYLNKGDNMKKELNQSPDSLLELKLAQKLTMGGTRIRMKIDDEEEFQKGIVLPKKKAKKTE